MNEFIKRLEDEAKLQTQLTRISTRFNFHLLLPFSIDNGVSHVAS